MSWTLPEDLRRQVERRWKNGDILRSLVRDDNAFPMRLRFSLPTPRDITLEYGRVRDWLDTLRSLQGVYVEWSDVRSRLAGQQKLPSDIWINSAEDAIALLQVQGDAERFLQLYAETSRTIPEITAWVEANPTRALSLERVWRPLLQVAAWKKSNPTVEPRFVRQIDLPGIDTKFIERNSSVLSEFFELVAPSEGVAKESTDFRVRYGFLRELGRVRFRILDHCLKFAGLPGCPDVELDEDSFSVLRIPVRRIFVTENKTNFLAFPPIEKSIIIFGAGYGMRSLGRARWMHDLPIYYWGDIDSHGFAILSQMREAFPHTRSFLMDEHTFICHQALWTTEATQTHHPADHLSAQETVVFERLCENGAWRRLRLEQEKIPVSVVEAAVKELLRTERSLA